jgi:hypothetical protein
LAPTEPLNPDGEWKATHTKQGTLRRKVKRYRKEQSERLARIKRKDYPIAVALIEAYRPECIRTEEDLYRGLILDEILAALDWLARHPVARRGQKRPFSVAARAALRRSRIMPPI